MITLSRLLADAWKTFRRDANLIVSVGAPFVFFPALAVQLLADPLPPLPATRDQAAIEAWLNTVTIWGQSNAGWYVLADAIGLFGLATLAVLLADRARPDVRGALSRAARLFLRFALASFLVAFPVGLGLWLLVLPGLYAQARLIAVLPALAAEQPLGAARSLGRSFAITRGHGWALLGAVLTVFLLQWLAIGLFAPVDAWLRQPAHLNPVLLVLVDVGMVAVAVIYRVAILLLGIVAYRRLASTGT